MDALAGAAPSATDDDPEETREWLDALQASVVHAGRERAVHLVHSVLQKSEALGLGVTNGASPSFNTPYLNSPALASALAPGQDLELEGRIEALVRWNALALVQRANRSGGDLGGHLASFASAATLYEVAFNHFLHASADTGRGDLVFYQGHASPGIYARAFLQGQLDRDELDRFRREAAGGGLSSYPHPWLMPGFWQFPTVSMGLGALQAIYQARFLRYIEARGLARTKHRKVWCFLGDGEMDEPESTGALGVAGRERLDNLVFVVNCNLQRLDGPVRGNGKIIQELERTFLGAGWNVVKLVWGSGWDPLLARDRSGLLERRMEECVDGEYQAFRARGGAYFRANFFGKYPELTELVRDFTDPELEELAWGGHDARKVHAAYRAASDERGRPSVVLAKTVKGFGMGESGEARNVAHQAKKLSVEAARSFRDRFGLGADLDDQRLEELEYLRPPDTAPEMRYLASHRAALGGLLPNRRADSEPLPVPSLDAFEELLRATAPISTTKAFARLLDLLLAHSELGPRIVPIVADEAQTFGMQILFRRCGIWAQDGQRYCSEDAESATPYREDPRGQVLQEGITEAGAMASWLAAATAYSVHGLSMIPFFIYYSMFGVQRIGDLWWAAGDSRARGFLLGATAGRTTLNGEGLQHQDGHSHVWAASIPNCVPYDPTFAHELAVIVHDGLRRMLSEQEDVFFYVTVMNERYAQPGLGAHDPREILRGMYRLAPRAEGHGATVELFGSGTILLEALAAAELLARDWGVHANVWSCPSFTVLAREAQAAERWNRLHPGATERRRCHLERCLDGRQGPFVAATDYVRAFAEQIRAWVPGRYVVLGTDGFGRSDTRERLRHFFEVDRRWITVAALGALADDGRLGRDQVAGAIARYGLDPEKPEPKGS
jgi:pyruvate dehydrogenase E1 component